ncbi:PapD-like protein, partial [Zopfochytrium polystomum]
ISFRRPFDKVVKRTMTLTNTTAETVAFKVRTTAPRAYCVRPNTGRIPPGATVEVEVMLQPNPETKGSMTRGSDCKDKFQVMSLVL